MCTFSNLVSPEIPDFYKNWRNLSNFEAFLELSPPPSEQTRQKQVPITATKTPFENMNSFMDDTITVVPVRHSMYQCLLIKR
mmetsp:Transcript_23597/g.38028  ORF Transcript_23597/g.38028 Transcript_23597/m.38028 type:complete len:82 (-) Transcript_23597:55-300(-)